MNAMAKLAAEENTAVFNFQTQGEVPAPQTRQQRQRATKIQRIARDVCQQHGLSMQAVMRGRGNRQTWDIRHEVYATAYAQGFSAKAIGRALGGRDHSTVMHGVKKYNEAMQ
jgi:chromosomal replication initiation ATPase DnaA